MRVGVCGFLILLIAGCATTSTDTDAPDQKTGSATTELGNSSPKGPVKAAEKKVSSVVGNVDVDVSDVGGRNLPARVELKTTDGVPVSIEEIPSGIKTIQPGVGDYFAFVYVYDEKVPIMVHAQELKVSEGKTAYILVNLLEGASGKLSVHDYDQDNDLAIDKVELIAGTDPEDPTSIPGRPLVKFDPRVFRDEERWYKGELNATSTYGGGQETVAELIARAERAGLDFLAITDMNTMDACSDPDFHSDSVVLIPAMAWGTPEQGTALIYGPATMPDLPSSVEAAQAECYRVQAQGGVFAIGKPCFPDTPWKWGLNQVNAVQVWSGDWRSPAPMHLSDLPEDIKIRSAGKLVRSIAAAAAVSDKTARAAAAATRKDLGVSANDQGALFWDYELVRGSVSSVIAGGGIEKRSDPMGAPVTWIKAPNKSAAGILHGLRVGRTFVSSKSDGVELDFSADALNDGTIDVGVGGAVPIGIDVSFHVSVFNAQGGTVQLLENGHQILTKNIDSNQYGFVFPLHVDYQSVFRLRVIRQPENPGNGYGPVDVLALSSPIYAADIGTELLSTLPVDYSKTWVRVDSEFVDDDPRLQQ